MKRSKTIEIAVSLCVLLVLCVSLNADDRDRQALGFLKEGYLRNRESFTTIDCEFEWRKGKAATRNDAFECRFIGEPTVQTGHWLVDGPLVRYELLCSPALVQETQRIMDKALKTGTNNVSIPCSDKYFLRSDAYSLNYGPVVLAANLFTKTDQDPDGIRITPFNPDCLGPDEYSSPARSIDAALGGRYEGQFLGSERLGGDEMLVVGLGPGLRQKFGFDPKRGYLMVYASDTDPNSGKRYYEVKVLEAKECPGGHWFPMRIVSVLSPDTSSPFAIRELKVLNLAVDAKPPRDSFQLQLPPGVQVNCIGRMEWLNIREATTITPQDLPALHERMKEVGEKYLQQQEAESATRNTNSVTRIVLISLAILLALVLAVALLFRWRLSKGHAS
jgi:hypothetical protein